MAIAPVLKTGARKGLGVRVPHPPLSDEIVHTVGLLGVEIVLALIWYFAFLT